MGPHPLTPLFEPRSIAVFGASESPDSVGGVVVGNLVDGGFAGEIVPINPKYETVAGRRCLRDVSALDAPVDLALVATPAASVPAILRGCAESGIRHVVVLSAGFGEADEAGKARQRELIELARRHRIALLGPNCVGLVLPWRRANASFLASAVPPGRLALVSQSGALCSAIADWAGPNHLGFSAVVSLGNSAVLDFGDVLGYLADDRHTEAILLYVEGVRRARPFLSALRAAARRKPVVVLKSGRHARSAQAATTHTGALIGSEQVFDAALERAGAVRARTFGQLFAAAEILSSKRRVDGNRLCIVTNGGGAGVLAADRAVELGLSLPPPSDATVGALEEVLPPFGASANPIDLLGDAGPDRFRRSVELCLADDASDGVLVMLTPQAMTRASDAAEAVIEAARGGDRPSRKPVLACWMGQAAVGEARRRLSESGIADFTTPERAVEAFSYLARHALNRRLALEVPGPLAHERVLRLDGARMIIDAALASGRELLSDRESKAVLHAFGVPVGQPVPARDAAEALVVAEGMGFPVAMKIASPDISHKSDVDGVRLNVLGAADVRPTFTDLLARAREHRPQARIDGVTIEPMARIEHARELLVGASRDPVFGPTMLFGAGGTMVDLLGDGAVALPPLTTVLAERLIDRTRVARLLESFRHRPAVDRRAVVGVLTRVSELLCELPQVTELDINPLLAGPSGVLAVDARIRVARPRADGGPYDHMAIAPYPRHLVEHGHLADGTALTIRPIRPEDAESEQRFVRGLSDSAKRFRFMHALRELSPEMLARFTQIDYSREMALVAETREDDGERQQGVARYVINPDGESGEFAVVVGDEKRHQGIGSRLMGALMRAARLHGLNALEGEVLADNRPMLELMRELGFDVLAIADEHEVVRVERRL